MAVGEHQPQYKVLFLFADKSFCRVRDFCEIFRSISFLFYILCVFILRL